MQLLRKKRRWEVVEEVAVALVCGTIATLVISCFMGCTIAPKPIQPAQVPFEGNARPGVIRLPDGGYEIIPDRRKAYDDLIAKGFGKAFLPPLIKDAGVKPLPDGNFEIDDQHLTDFIAMAARLRRGEKP